MDEAQIRPLLGLFLATEGRAGLATAARLVATAGDLALWWPERRRTGPPGALLPGLETALLDEGLERRIDALLADFARIGFVVDPGTSWPAFRALPDPPLVVIRKGLPPDDLPMLTIVGARSASAYGLRIAARLAGGLAAGGVVIVSGLARGIDAAAHRAALETGGRTVAVLGSGPDVPYPPEHLPLFSRIAAEGTLLTEHLPGAPPLARHFPRRNRLLAALGRAVLLVEARIKSGSLTTVRWAADLGRDVLVVPGPVDAPLSEGPLQLLREGATAVGSVDHVLEAMGLSALRPNAEASQPGEVVPAETEGGEGVGTRRVREVLSAAEARIVALAEGSPVDLDDLVRLASDPPSVVITAVLSLEARGVLRRSGDGRSFTAE